MSMRSTTLLAAATTTGLLVLSGCSGPQRHTFDAAEVAITYAFVDGSVAPEYHRSFTLAVEAGTGTLVVDVYGEELHRAEAAIDQGAVEDLLASYADGDLDRAFDPEDSADGCTGGSTFILRIEDQSSGVIESTDIYRCLSNDESMAELRRATDPLVAHFDIEDLTDGRYRLGG